MPVEVEVEAATLEAVEVVLPMLEAAVVVVSRLEREALEVEVCMSAVDNPRRVAWAVVPHHNNRVVDIHRRSIARRRSVNHTLVGSSRKDQLLRIPRSDRQRALRWERVRSEFSRTSGKSASLRPSDRSGSTRASRVPSANLARTLAVAAIVISGAEREPRHN